VFLKADKIKVNSSSKERRGLCGRVCPAVGSAVQLGDQLALSPTSANSRSEH
jgi:hypothetical protein